MNENEMAMEGAVMITPAQFIASLAAQAKEHEEQVLAMSPDEVVEMAHSSLESTFLISEGLQTAIAAGTATAIDMISVRAIDRLASALEEVVIWMENKFELSPKSGEALAAAAEAVAPEEDDDL
jgi:hypothetical protein